MGYDDAGDVLAGAPPAGAGPQQVRLTAAGERLLPEARAVLAAAGRVRRVAADVAGTGPPTWTVLYTAAADLMPARRVAFRPLAGLTAQTWLAVPPGPPAPALRRLLDACASANADPNQARTITDVHDPVGHGTVYERSLQGG